MHKIKPYAIPSLLFLLSFLLRLSLISKGPYHLDCLVLARTVGNTVNDLILYSYNGPGHPLTVLLGAIIHGLFKMFGIFDPVTAVNFMSVLFSSLSIPLLYLIGKELFNKETALLSAVMLSICPIFLGLSVYGKSQVPALFFVLAAIYYLIVYQKSGRQKPLIMSALLLGLAAATRIYTIVFMFWPISFFFIWGTDTEHYRLSKLRERLTWTKFFTYWGTVALTSSIFYLMIILVASPETYLKKLAPTLETNLFNNFLGLFSPSLITSFEFLFDTLTPIGLLLAFGGLIILFKSQKGIAGFLLLWFLVPLFFYGNLRTTVTPRYFVLLLPALLLAQAFIVDHIAQKNVLTKYVSYFVFVCMALWLFTSMVPILKYRHDHATLPDFARWVGQVTEPNAKIIATEERSFIVYYGKRTTLRRPAQFARPYTQEELTAFKDMLDEELGKGTPVYATTTSLYAYDKGSQFSDFFKQYYEGKFIGRHLYEDWHFGSMKLQVAPISLYQIRRIKPNSL